MPAGAQVAVPPDRRPKARTLVCARPPQDSNHGALNQYRLADEGEPGEFPFGCQMEMLRVRIVVE